MNLRNCTIILCWGQCNAEAPLHPLHQLCVLVQNSSCNNGINWTLAVVAETACATCVKSATIFLHVLHASIIRCVSRRCPCPRCVGSFWVVAVPWLGSFQRRFADIFHLLALVLVSAFDASCQWCRLIFWPSHLLVLFRPALLVTVLMSILWMHQLCVLYRQLLLLSLGVLRRRGVVRKYWLNSFGLLSLDLSSQNPRRCKTSLVGQSAGRSVPRSSVRFRPKLPKSRTQLYIWATYTLKQRYWIAVSNNNSNH